MFFNKNFIFRRTTMSFCKFCGKRLENGEVCDCAAAQEEYAQGAGSTENQDGVQSEEVKKQGSQQAEQLKSTYNDLKEKAIKFFSVKRNAGIALGCVGVLVLILIITGLGGGYKKPLDNIVKLFDNQETDMDECVELVAPKFLVKYYDNIVDILEKSDELKDMKDDVEDSLESMYEGLEEQYGKKYSVSYKITDKEKMSKDDLEDIEDTYKSFYEVYLESAYDELKDADDDYYEEMEDELDLSSKECEKLVDECKPLIKEFKSPKVSEGYELTVEVKIEGKDDDDEEEIDVNVIKFNGDWMLDYASFFDELGISIGSLIRNFY